MKPNGEFSLVLPAREILHDHLPADFLLSTFGTSTHDLVVLFLTTWADLKNKDRIHDYECHTLDYRSALRITAHLLVADIVFETIERQVEAGERSILSEEDRRAAEKVMMSIWGSLCTHVFELLDSLGVTEDQATQLRFDRWIADDIVITLPRNHSTTSHVPWGA